MKKYFPKHKGFVILFTMLISTIILMIGLGIFSIATRETVLSGTSREAQYAFYAADAGVECALYAASLVPSVLVSGGGSFDCGMNPSVVTGDGKYPDLPFIFNILVDQDQKSCAQVTVFDIDGGSVRRIISQGYNICSDEGKPLSNNPILVERDLDVRYATGIPAPNPSAPQGPTAPVTGTPLNTLDTTVLKGTPLGAQRFGIPSTQ